MKYYLPEEEPKSDARDIYKKFFDPVSMEFVDRLITDEDPQEAAELAAKWDYDNCDGWERTNNEFKLVVIDDDEEEHCFTIEREYEPVFTAQPEED